MLSSLHHDNDMCELEHINACIRILDSLIYNPSHLPGTHDEGIALSADKPMNNHIMVNVQRPAVLRQYFGVINDSGDMISAYALGTGSTTVGTSPRLVLFVAVCSVIALHIESSELNHTIVSGTW